MTSESQVWHYGLIARMWAELDLDTPELAYYQTKIEAYGQPALDVACGTGRLLLPLLRAGFDVDGCDMSRDMLGRCLENATREGLSPQLYEQAMQQLDLPRRYKTIFVCDSFGLAGSRQLDLESLRRFYQHLEPGGALAFNMHPPYKSPGEWQYWVREKRQELPEPWPQEGKERRAPNGTEYVSWVRLIDIDPLEQILTRQMRVELREKGRVVAEEVGTLTRCMYFKNELVMMLEKVGLRDVMVEGEYSEEVATAEQNDLIYLARK